MPAIVPRRILSRSSLSVLMPGLSMERLRPVRLDASAFRVNRHASLPVKGILSHGRCDQMSIRRPPSAGVTVGFVVQMSSRASSGQAVRTGYIGKLPSQKRATSAQTGHHGSDGNLQDFRCFLVRKILYVSQ